ncbi:MAG: hypothetical protein Q9213_005628 [Squamulea squamosa]
MASGRPGTGAASSQENDNDFGTTTQVALAITMTRNDAEAYLIMLSNIPDEELLSSSTLSWPHLYESYRVLGMPHCEDRSSFDYVWAHRGANFPFHEQYLIHTGRVDQLTTMNVSLALDINLDLADPFALRSFRDAAQDPALATKLRDEAQEKRSRLT